MTIRNRSRTGKKNKKKNAKKRFFFVWICHIGNILKKDRRQKK